MMFDKTKSQRKLTGQDDSSPNEQKTGDENDGKKKKNMTIAESDKNRMHSRKNKAWYC